MSKFIELYCYWLLSLLNRKILKILMIRGNKWTKYNKKSQKEVAMQIYVCFIYPVLRLLDKRWQLCWISVWDFIYFITRSYLSQALNLVNTVIKSIFTQNRNVFKDAVKHRYEPFSQKQTVALSRKPFSQIKLYQECLSAS